MIKNIVLGFITLVSLANINLQATALERSTTLSIPEKIRDFALIDNKGRYHRLYDYADHAAVVILAHGIGCPNLGRSIPFWKAIQKHYRERNVAFLLLNSNPREGRATINKNAAKLGIETPVLEDPSQLVAEELGLTHVSEAVVLTPHDWRVVYRGPVDARLAVAGKQDGDPSFELVQVLDEVVTSRSPRFRELEVKECRFHSPSAQTISYQNEIVPLLTSKCVGCHHHGGIGPWAMDSYQTIKAWSPRIRNVIMTRLMPPWHADPEVGHFLNDRSLTPEQQRTLVHWIDQGAPNDTSNDPLLSKADQRQNEWFLGKPDLIIDLPPQKIPAKGVIPYRHLWIDAPIDHDVWVRAVQFKPSNKEVMHHGFAFIQYPERLRHLQPMWDKLRAATTYFAVYAPGYNDTPLPDHVGMRLPAGSRFLFQLHYTVMGKATLDHPQLGIYLRNQPPKYELFTGTNDSIMDLRIPPYVREYKVEADYKFDDAVQLIGFFPHMHYRGKWIRYELIPPKGPETTLLSVPKYYFNWQTLYLLQDPVPVPPGSVMRIRGAFDNSPYNPANPDPGKEVRWGNQSWNEMFLGYFLYARKLPSSNP